MLCVNLGLPTVKNDHGQPSRTGGWWCLPSITNWFTGRIWVLSNIPFYSPLAMMNMAWLIWVVLNHQVQFCCSRGMDTEILNVVATTIVAIPAANSSSSSSNHGMEVEAGKDMAGKAIGMLGRALASKGHQPFHMLDSHFPHDHHQLHEREHH